jgi:hypothetical protein
MKTLTTRLSFHRASGIPTALRQTMSATERRTLSSWAVCRLAGSALDAVLRRFPPLVRIETTNACNARCVICPHSRLHRPIQRMEDGLFQRIIDECATARCREVHLHNFGEPLLDNHLEERVRYAKQKGLKKVTLFSNGSLLTEQRARGLLEAGLDEIKISFDGATRQEFEQVRVPLKFDRVVENIHCLVALRNEMRSPMKIHVACCSTSDKQGTMQMLEKLVDGFAFGKIHNWGVPDSLNRRNDRRKPCSRLWRTLTVLAGGEVSLCCLDYDGRHVLGRLTEDQTIARVWHSNAYRAVRHLHKTARQSEIELCRGCSKAFL